MMQQQQQQQGPAASKAASSAEVRDELLASYAANAISKSALTDTWTVRR
jgi:hypothetical protein